MFNITFIVNNKDNNKVCYPCERAHEFNKYCKKNTILRSFDLQKDLKQENKLSESCKYAFN